MEYKVPAKLNLSLAVTGKINGMHTLDMEVCSVDLYDKISCERKSDGLDMRLSGYDGLDVDKFLPVLQRAADRFFARYGKCGAEITVEKNIPLGAGLGGSSAAVAGVVAALADLKNVRLDNAFVLSLGSDVPYMLRGGRCRVGGTGNVLRSLPEKPLFFVVLIGRNGVDSAQAYALYDLIGAMPFGVRRNDLELAARKLNGEVESARRALESAGAADVVMSGSGSAVAAVFNDAETAEKVFDSVRFDVSKYLLHSVPRS